MEPGFPAAALRPPASGALPLLPARGMRPWNTHRQNQHLSGPVLQSDNFLDVMLDPIILQPRLLPLPAQ